MKKIKQIYKCEYFTDCCTHYNGTKAFKIGYWKSPFFRFALCEDCETPTLIANSFWSWLFINIFSVFFDGKLLIPNDDIEYFYQNGEFLSQWLYDKDEEKHEYFCPQCGIKLSYLSDMDLYLCDECKILGTKKYNKFDFVKGIKIIEENEITE